MAFPQQRPRRLRSGAFIRDLVRETALQPDDFILPLFVSAEKDMKQPMSAMPGNYLMSGRPLVEFAREAHARGVPALLFFAVVDPSLKDLDASQAMSPDGAVQRAMADIREAVPEMGLIADLCLCEYRSDGHCGVYRDGVLDNDGTLEKLAEISVSFANAGADVIAPSGMMDGAVLAIRTALDTAGLVNTMTMPYSAKFCSALYGPFKAGTDSSPDVGLHHTHQMDVANGREALRQIEADVEQGADMIIVKPALTSLDIIRSAKDCFGLPTAAYHVSGESAMIRAAGEGGYIDAQAVMMESLVCIKRAGADMIITYSALDAIELL